MLVATARQLLDIARAELGTKESPAGSNQVKYASWYGLPGQPWCVMFVMWVFSQAGTALPTRTASCTLLMRAAQAAGCWVTDGCRPGDVVIYDWGPDGIPDHCGIVEDVSGGTITAIEGNTAVRNDSDGGEVMRRERKTSQILGAVRPLYEEECMDIDSLTDEDLIRLADRMQTALSRRPVSETLAPELAEAVAAGITDGSSPNAFCTRVQAAVMVARATRKG